LAAADLGQRLENEWRDDAIRWALPLPPSCMPVPRHAPSSQCAELKAAFPNPGQRHIPMWVAMQRIPRPHAAWAVLGIGEAVAATTRSAAGPLARGRRWCGRPRARAPA